MTAIRQLGRSAIGYTIGNFIRRLGGLFLIPLYTSALSVSQYGEYETLRTISDTLAILVNFGMSSALVRFHSECRDEQEIGVMMRTSSVIVLLLSFAFFGLFLPFGDDISLFLFKSRRLATFIALAFLWSIGASLNQQLFAYYRARQDTSTYVLFSTGLFLILVIFNVLLVRVLHMGVLGILLGNLIPLWVIDVLVAVRFWRQGLTLSWQWARKLLGFGVPFIFAGFGWLILNSSDRYFLASFKDLSEVGFYGLGYKAGFIMQMAVVLPFNLAWAPFVFARYEKDRRQAPHDFSRVFTYALLAFSLVGVGMYLFAEELVYVLGSGKFHGAAAVVPFVLAASAFHGIFFWSAALIHLRKKTVAISVIVTTMAFANLLLNWLLIPNWGWRGAAWTTVFTIGGVGILTLITSLHLYYVPLQHARILKVVLCVAVITGLYFWLPHVDGAWSWLLRITLWLLLPLLLYTFGFFADSEIRFIRNLPDRLSRELRFSVRHEQ